MDYFLKLFGEISVGWAVVAIAAIIFIIGCYKKIERYFADKTILEKEKEERIQQVIEQAEQYPKWHQQSIDIRDALDNSIDELGNKFDRVNDTLCELKKAISESHATTCRYRIIRFDDEIRHDEKHSKEHFDQILDDITEYEQYCNNHPDYKNNKAELAIANIKRVYQNCSNEGTFI